LLRDGDGRWTISVKEIGCPVVGKRQYKFIGSNPWFLKIQCRNVKFPIKSLEILFKSTYTVMKKGQDGAFVLSLNHLTNKTVILRATDTKGTKFIDTVNIKMDETTIPDQIVDAL
jgi:expansin (peptidoglycan-binding protein)